MEIPKHLAVVLDGNRRWARKHNLSIWRGHREGAKNFDKFMRWCADLDIPQVSAYVLSTENLDRPKKELDELFKIYYNYLEKYTKKEDKLFDKYEVKVRFIGDMSKLPLKLVRLMGKLMEKTAKYQKKTLNILIAYSSRFELTETMKKIAEKIIREGRIEVTEKDIEQNLLVSVPVDLTIRTGGMYRMSNFLLWQTAYSELYFTKTLWPDFSKKELIKAIKWYNSVQKNFGR